MMMKQEVRDKGSSNSSWAQLCDTCRAVPCTVYCRADSAYLCTGCDAQVHGANQVASRHERVWVCEACEQAPAAFLCKADAASLCATCDADIHSANPLARRHHRVPILPIAGCLYGRPPATDHPGGRMMRRSMVGGDDDDDGFLAPEIMSINEEEEEEEDETASWLVLNPVKGGSNYNHTSSDGYLMGGDVDEYLDLVEYNSSSGADSQFAEEQEEYYSIPSQKSYGIGGDSVVPVQSAELAKDHLQYDQQQQPGLQLEMMDYKTKPAAAGYTSMSHSVSVSVSVSSMDAAGVVPDSTMSDHLQSVSVVSHPKNPKGTIDLFSAGGPPSVQVQMPIQLSPVDREARVLRYREKKKMRKFEKTIRYASRKAYAETRPRIKGRFAKRSDINVEVDHQLLFPNTTMHADAAGYGIVPSF